MLRSFKPLVLSVVLLIAPLCLTATSIVDQSNVPGTNYYNPLGPTSVPSAPYAWMGQSFTVGVTGQLTEIDAELDYPNYGTNATFTMQLVQLSGGLPTGSVLGTVSQTLGYGQGFYAFDFTSQDIFVTNGEQLAYVFTAADFSRWLSSSGDSYASGTSYMEFPGATDGSPTSWTAKNYDAYFQTRVDPTATPAPEPASLTLLAAGIGGVIMRRRRK